MALLVRPIGISRYFKPDELDCLVRTAAEAVNGDLDDLSERQRELADRAYGHLQDETHDLDTESTRNENPMKYIIALVLAGIAGFGTWHYTDHVPVSVGIGVVVFIAAVFGLYVLLWFDA